MNIAELSIRKSVITWVLTIVMVVVGLISIGVISLDPESLSNAFGVLLLGITVVFFGWLFLAGDWTPVERGRLWAIVALFIAIAKAYQIFLKQDQRPRTLRRGLRLLVAIASVQVAANPLPFQTSEGATELAGSSVRRRSDPCLLPDASMRAK